MLTVNFSKNIEKYQENVIGGFNLEKSIYIGISVIVGLICMAIYILLFKIDIIISVWLSMPFLLIVILFGFYKKDGLTFSQMIYRIRYSNNKKPNIMSATDNFATYQKLLLKEKELVNKNENNVDDFQKTIAKIKMYMMIGAAALSIIITIIIVVVIL